MAVYRHRQSSRLLPLLTLLAVVALVVAALAGERPAVFVPLAITAFVLALVTLAFSSLTVVVGDEELEWFFGRGFCRKRIARTEISTNAIVRNPWWYGFGIHRTPRGWLYNVGGLDAVEITLVSGRMLRIGSDEPNALAAALQRH